MSYSVCINRSINVDFETTIYDVVIDGMGIEFTASLDSDGDVRIQLDESSFNEAAIDYLRRNNTDDELKELFGLEG